MTDNEMRIAIAEECGWERIKEPTEYEWKRLNGQWQHGWEYRSELPDYLNDLNACREMEKRLPASVRDIYQDWLARVVERERRMATISWLCINATARQRAEAFLRTVGKWKEPQTVETPIAHQT